MRTHSDDYDEFQGIIAFEGVQGCVWFFVISLRERLIPQALCSTDLMSALELR